MRKHILALITAGVIIAASTVAFAAQGRGNSGGGGKPPKDDPPPTPANQTIVLEQRARAKTDLVVVNADGSNETVVYKGGRGTFAWNPSWSPDGAWLVFDIDSNKDPEGVFVTSSDGSENPVQLVADNVDEMIRVDEAAWSPDGRWIAYRAIPESLAREIHLVDVDGLGDGPTFPAPTPIPLLFGAFGNYDNYHEPTWGPLPSGSSLQKMAVTTWFPEDPHNGQSVLTDILIFDIGLPPAYAPVALGSPTSLRGVNAASFLADEVTFPTLDQPSWAKKHDRWMTIEVTDWTDSQLQGWDVWFVDPTGECAPVNLTNDPSLGFEAADWSGDDPTTGIDETDMQIVVESRTVGGNYVMDVQDDGTCVTGASAPSFIGDVGNRPSWKR